MGAPEPSRSGRRAALVLLVAGLLAPAAAAQRATVPASRIRPATPVAPAASAAATPTAIDGEEVRLALPLGRPEALALPFVAAEGPRTLLLQRHSLRAPDLRLRAWGPDGEQLVAPPPPATYRGEVLEEPGTVVLAALSDAGLDAHLLRPDGAVLRLRPDARAADRVAHRLGPDVDDLFALAPCGADHLPAPDPAIGGAAPGQEELSTGPLPELPAGPAPGGPGGTPHAGGPGAARGAVVGTPGPNAPVTCISLCELAFDCDFEYFQAKGSDVVAVLDSVEAHMNVVDFFYARDTQITYQLPEVVVRTAPFYTPTSGGDLLVQFRDEWNGNQAGVVRDIAQLLTGKPGSLIEFGGLAYVGVMCTSSGYGWSMDNTNALGHEIGHNWGSGHCHDVEPCNTMCGGCFYVGPNTKDIMVATRDGAPCLDVVGFYNTPVPPYAHPERLELRKDELDGLGSVAFDVLANDHDGNCEPLTLGPFTATGTEGGSLSLSPGTGPDGRDELVYTPPADVFVGEDRFTYVVRDPRGWQAGGRLTVESRPLDLAGAWPLDDGAGTVATDATTHGRDGTTSGGPVWTSGQLAGALEFDGTNDAVTIPALGLDTDQLTLSCWLRRDGPQNGFAGVVFCRDGSTTAGLNFGNVNELRYHWNDAASSYNWNSGLVVPDQSWVFVALVVEPQQATMYLYDGALQAAVNPVAHGPEAFDGVLSLGLDPGSTVRDFRGTLDDVRVYDHALDATEVLDLALRGGAAGSPTPADGGRLAEPAWGLDWLASPLADSHDVYLGTSYTAVRDATTGSGAFQGNQPGTGFVPGALLPDTTYYWRVDERVGGAVVRGPVWQFRLARRHRWGLDETAGTLAGDAAGGADGLYIGNPLLGTPGATPTTGLSVDLDGNNDRVRVNPLLLDTNTVTMTAWVRRDGAQSPWSGLVFSREQSTTAGLNLGEAHELRYHWDGGQWPWNSGLVLPNQTWTFVALVVRPDGATIAMSSGGGLLFASQAATHAREAFDGALEVGRDPGFSNRWFDGRVDDVRVYDAALTDAELERLFLESL